MSTLKRYEKQNGAEKTLTKSVFLPLPHKFEAYNCLSMINNIKIHSEIVYKIL